MSQLASPQTQPSPATQQPRGTAVELCCGLGGIGIALRALGFSVAKAYDSWAEAVAIYNQNTPDDAASECNLLTTKGREFIKAAIYSLDSVELLAAGPPCKGFSRLQNGFHDGRNGHNRVLASMPAYVEIIRPRMFLIENVPDLARHRDGRTLATLIQSLRRPAKSLRYRVHHRVYDASQYGTPQARRRLLIFGVRYGSGEERLPEPQPDLSPLYAALRHGGKVPHELAQFHSVLKDAENDSLVSAHQALSDLPVLNAGDNSGEAAYATAPQSAFQRWVRQGASARVQDMRTPRVTDDAVARLKHIPPGGCARSIPTKYLNGLARRYDSAYRRLHPDSPSTSLSTRYDCVYHYAKARSLSVREYARLQGLPDAITFPQTLASRRSAYEMIGNSVPPRLVEGVLRAALAGEDLRE